MKQQKNRRAKKKSAEKKADCVNREERAKRMPGEFEPELIKIGIDDCRGPLQHYYAIGGHQYPFATFKGHVESKQKHKGYVLKNLYVEFEDYDYRSCSTIKAIVDHVWIYDMEPLEKCGIQIGDDIQFTALVYAYHRQDGTEDYSLKGLQDIKKIESYDIAKHEEGIKENDKELHKQFIQDLICETCLMTDHCDGDICLYR